MIMLLYKYIYLEHGMSFIRTGIWLSLLALPGVGWAQDVRVTKAGESSIPCQIAPERREAPISCQDVSDILPDAATAYAVGMAILTRRYGAEALKYPEPYEAKFDSHREEWCIDRALFPPGVSIKDRLPRKGGGHPYVCLLKKDGRIMSIGLSI
jgi:hypothetical protein